MLPGDNESPLAEAAARLGLQYRPSSFDARGGSRGAKVLGWGGPRDRMALGRFGQVGVRVMENSSRTRLAYLYGVAFPPLGVALELRRQHWWRRVWLSLLSPEPGGEVSAFDALVRVGGRAREESELYLTAERRRAVAELMHVMPRTRIGREHIDGFDAFYRFSRPAADGIVLRVRLLVAAARGLMEAPDDAG
ncbi:MAG: hypothetical protein H6Q11_925 [Acidobacteria bacterium]|nr:hypothetical protein [Acidobacteriota bacterium]